MSRQIRDIGFEKDWGSEIQEYKSEDGESSPSFTKWN